MLGIGGRVWALEVEWKEQDGAAEPYIAAIQLVRLRGFEQISSSSTYHTTQP